MTKFYIIVNPISGRGMGLKSIPELNTQLTDAGFNYELVQTLKPGHAIELAKQAVLDSYDVVVAVGGDGTANEVLNGILEAKLVSEKMPTLGVIAIGRGNDFAYGLGISPGLSNGIKILSEGHRKKIDVGCVKGGLYPNGRYFGNGVGIGFDAVVGFEAVKMKRLSGFPSYIVAVVKTVFLYFHAPNTHIHFDKNEIDISPLMVSVMNGRRMGGGFMMAPTSTNDDGLFDICMVKEAGKLRIFGLVPHFLKGTQASQPEVTMIQAKLIQVNAREGSLPVHADGETICEAGDSLIIELLPDAIDILHPVLG